MIAQLFVLWMAESIIMQTIINMFLLHYEKNRDIIKSLRATWLLFYTMTTALIEQKIEQKFHKNLVKVSKNRYDLRFIYGCNTYKIRIRTNPCDGEDKPYIISILNENKADITDDIMPYAGPNNDFFRIPYTPTDFNCELLCFVLSTNETFYFSKHEFIVLPP